MKRALLGACLLVVAGCGGGSGPQSASPVPTASHAWHGVEPVPVRDRPKFVLTDTEGERYDFHAETTGRPTFVYFGYTNCPDECPTAMADVATALRRQPAAIRERAVVVFVTTDPERDSAALLRRWLDQFSTSFVGLRGTKAELEAAQRAAGVAPAQKQGPIPTLPGKPNEHEHKSGTRPHTHLGPLGYGVGHAAVIFAYDSTDHLPVVYPGGVTPSDIAADLPALAGTR